MFGVPKRHELQLALRRGTATVEMVTLFLLHNEPESLRLPIRRLLIDFLATHQQSRLRMPKFADFELADFRFRLRQPVSGTKAARRAKKAHDSIVRQLGSLRKLESVKVTIL